MLRDTLVIWGGEFGRTPMFQGKGGPGRDHHIKGFSMWLAGGGVKGGKVVGSSDKTGGYPASDPQTPENMAATIYQSLGLPDTTAWYDELNRPHHIYYGEPIPGLT